MACVLQYNNNFNINSGKYDLNTYNFKSNSYLSNILKSLQENIALKPQKIDLSKYSIIKELYNKKSEKYCIMKEISKLSDIFDDESQVKYNHHLYQGQNYNIMNIVIFAAVKNNSSRNYNEYDIVFVCDKKYNIVRDIKYFCNSPLSANYMTQFISNSNSYMTQFISNLSQQKGYNDTIYDKSMNHGMSYKEFIKLAKYIKKEYLKNNDIDTVPIFCFGNGFSSMGMKKVKSKHNTTNEVTNNDTISTYSADKVVIKFDKNEGTKIIKSNVNPGSEYVLYGYKIAKTVNNEPCIVKLGIKEHATVIKGIAEYNKLRVNRCDVLAIGRIVYADYFTKYIYDQDIAVNSIYSGKSIIYKINEEVMVKNFCSDITKVCAPGIHFFLNQIDAIFYNNAIRHCRAIFFDAGEEMANIDPSIQVESDDEEIIEDIHDGIEFQDAIYDDNNGLIGLVVDPIELDIIETDSENIVYDDFEISYDFQINAKFDIMDNELPLPDHIINDIKESFNKHRNDINKAYVNIKVNKYKKQGNAIPKSIEELNLEFTINDD